MEVDIRFKDKEEDIERVLNNVDLYLNAWDIDVDYEVVQK